MRACLPLLLTLGLSLMACSCGSSSGHDAGPADAGMDAASAHDASLDAMTADAATDAAAPTDAGPGVSCDVDGGTCGAGSICVHVCDCCGIPTGDGGPTPSGHDECIEDTGQCGSLFMVGAHECTCRTGGQEADCPCA